MSDNGKSKKNIRIVILTSKDIADMIEQVRIEENRTSFGNTAETLVIEALEARKKKGTEAGNGIATKAV